MNKIINFLLTKPFLLESISLLIICVIILTVDLAGFKWGNMALLCVVFFLLSDILSIILDKWKIVGNFVKKIHIGVTVLAAALFILGSILILKGPNAVEMDSIYTSTVLIYLLLRIGRYIIKYTNAELN